MSTLIMFSFGVDWLPECAGCCSVHSQQPPSKQPPNPPLAKVQHKLSSTVSAKMRTGNAHGQANVGLLQGGRVVGAVAGHRHDVAQLLQQLHQMELVLRRAARQHLPTEQQ